MATHTQILPSQEFMRRPVVTDSRTGFFRRFFAPVVMQKPMSEKDIKQYLYPDAAVSIQCHVVTALEKS